jgi:protein transport protein SEC61 subunit beta
MLQFYTDDAPGLKISPNVVLVMSIGFIAFVAILHVIGKLYLRKEA